MYGIPRGGREAMTKIGRVVEPPDCGLTLVKTAQDNLPVSVSVPTQRSEMRRSRLVLLRPETDL